ncbi:MAG TPA: NAD-dependent epimerase/dehydratase family protein [Blattabacteriaceae bacterium]|nr:NAD-dependent epimerase/dehydratase family protein [Blattabacteriaceae bacterium]
MKILLIGGSGFIGPFTAAQLQQSGHNVTIFNRGKTSAPQGTEEILGDRQFLQDHQPEFRRQKFDVVVDFVLSSGRQAQQLMDTFRGIAGRVVGLSSMDVYRAWGVFYNMEPGGLQELPLIEDSELRTSRNTYPPDVLKRLRTSLYPWIDEEYDKIPVEQAVLGDTKLPGTILRLPMIYGPGDPLHRFYPVLKRIDDGRKQIIFADDVVPLRTPRGYVEDVAAAVALAATSPQAAGRVYNVSETESFGELDWARKIAAAADWAANSSCCRITARPSTCSRRETPRSMWWHLLSASAKSLTIASFCRMMKPFAAPSSGSAQILRRNRQPNSITLRKTKRCGNSKRLRKIGNRIPSTTLGIIGIR